MTSAPFSNGAGAAGNPRATGQGAGAAVSGVAPGSRAR